MVGCLVDFVFFNADPGFETPPFTTLSRLYRCPLESSQPLLEVPGPHGLRWEAGDQVPETCLIEVHCNEEIHWKQGFLEL